jgi:hypothetical protein
MISENKDYDRIWAMFNEFNGSKKTSRRPWSRPWNSWFHRFKFHLSKDGRNLESGSSGTSCSVAVKSLGGATASVFPFDEQWSTEAVLRHLETLVFLRWQ